MSELAAILVLLYLLAFCLVVPLLFFAYIAYSAYDLYRDVRDTPKLLRHYRVLPHRQGRIGAERAIAPSRPHYGLLEVCGGAEEGLTDYVLRTEVESMGTRRPAQILIGAGDWLQCVGPTGELVWSGRVEFTALLGRPRLPAEWRDWFRQGLRAELVPAARQHRRLILRES